MQIGPETETAITIDSSSSETSTSSSTTTVPNTTPEYYFRRAGGGGGAATLASTVAAVDVTFNLVVATGDLYYLTRHVHPPLKLSPPYQRAVSTDGYKNHTAQVCHAEPGRHYIGLNV